MGLGGRELEERTGSKAEGSTSSLLPKFTFLDGFCYKVENEMLLDVLLRLRWAFLWPLPRCPHPRARHLTSQRLCNTVISKGSPGPAWGTITGNRVHVTTSCLAKAEMARVQEWNLVEEIKAFSLIFRKTSDDPSAFLAVTGGNRTNLPTSLFLDLLINKLSHFFFNSELCQLL